MARRSPQSQTPAAKAAPGSEPGEQNATHPAVHDTAEDARQRGVQVVSRILDRIEDLHQKIETLAGPGDSEHAHAGTSAGASSAALPENALDSLTQTLTSQLAESVGALQEQQAAAAASQTEVLRTLTEAIFQSAGNTGLTRDDLRHAVTDMEERMTERLLLALQNVSAGAAGGSTANTGAASRTEPAPSVPASVRRKSWNDIRRELLEQDQPAQEEEITLSAEEDDRDSGRNQSRAAGADALARTQAFEMPVQEPALEIPEGIDIDSADPAELREFVRRREQLLGLLVGRIRKLQTSQSHHFSAEQLRRLQETAPEDLRLQIQESLGRLDDQIRVGELELSLDRARVARMASQMDETRERLRRTAQQFGLELNEDGSLKGNSPVAARNSSSRRWLGKLGFSNGT